MSVNNTILTASLLLLGGGALLTALPFSPSPARVQLGEGSPPRRVVFLPETPTQQKPARHGKTAVTFQPTLAPAYDFGDAVRRGPVHAPVSRVAE